jgi:curved DNA-binding protein CbpA
VRSANVPRADQLDTEGRVPGTPAFDPYAILKVARDANPEDIKSAYHRMARLYHPDRIASYELPDEVKDYVRTMLVRINLAFEQIGS